MLSRKFLKYIVLVLAFVIPGFVFFFLKKFGKNEFEVAPLYQDGPPVQAPGCPPFGPEPYRVPDAILDSLGGFGSTPLILYAFIREDQQLMRVKESFAANEITLVKVMTVRDSLARCYLFIAEQKPLVLVDQDRRIRGHYFNTREDVDRLLTEAAIILKKY
ncbi:MAG: hypothetical protein HRU69_14715 [Flammeovirgaceae bacterium]|nr:MAG: hypothetical protein HRU69_14715 [Flammeovirgaceae bacterium]